MLGLTGYADGRPTSGDGALIFWMLLKASPGLRPERSDTLPSTLTAEMGGSRGQTTVSTYSVIEHVSIIGSIPLALTGFGITFWQLLKTKKAAIAARLAAENATRNINRSTFIMLVPQLMTVEGELDEAVRRGSLELTLLSLRTWRSHAVQVRGLLDLVAPGDNPKVLRAIQNSVSSVVSAKSRLTETPGEDLAMATRQVRKAIATVTTELGVLAVAELAEVGGAVHE
jgi:hypothetical protein